MTNQIYRGYDIGLENGLYAIYRNGNHVYTLPTTNNEEAAYAWIDAEKKRQANAS